MTAALAAGIFWLAYDHGSYGVASRTTLAIAVWWAVLLGVATGLVPLQGVRRPTVVIGALLVAFLAWTLLSVTWSDTAENVFVEFDRVALYLGVFVLVALAATRRDVGCWSDGIALAITLTALLALTTRCFPTLISTGGAFRYLPFGLTRLNYPLGYWNGLAIFTALAVPLLLRSAVVARRTLTRGLAVTPLPAFAAVLYLTSSRTGIAATAVGVLAFFVLAPRRWLSLGAIVVAGAGAAVVAAALAARDTLVNGPLGTAAARHEGRTAALWILAAAVLTGLVWSALSGILSRRSPRGASERVLVAVTAVVIVGAVVAAHPIRRFDNFRQLPAARATNVQSHLLSVNGNGRWQMWRAAYHEGRHHPLAGGGAGSFQAWWERHRPYPLFVRDAHSLYLEVFGELGVVGLLLIASMVVAGALIGAGRALRGGAYERTTSAALAAAFLTFAVAAAADWMWELTAVGVVGVALLSLTVHATAPPRGERRSFPRAGRLAVAAVAVTLIGAQAILMLADLKLGASQAAVRRGDTRSALASALDARSIEPWASSPYLQLALITERERRIRQARRWAQQAIDRAPSSWTLWIVAARLAAKDGSIGAARRSLQEAHRLNPLAGLPTVGR